MKVSSRGADRLGPSGGSQSDEVSLPSCKAESVSGAAMEPEGPWGPTEEKQRRREGARRPVPGVPVEDSRAPALGVICLRSITKARCVWPTPRGARRAGRRQDTGLVWCSHSLLRDFLLPPFTVTFM